MPLPRASAAPCLLLFIKGPLKEGLRLFAFGLLDFGLEDLWGFGLGFGFILLLWTFWCGKQGKRITEGKRIAKGKLLKGKVWLKRGG
jgi:hypothetical protein